MAEEDLIIAVIQSAYEIYTTDSYPANLEAPTFASPRQEVIAFFHSRRFETLCQAVGLDSFQVRERGDIPQPHRGCNCESCCTDYRLEAELVKDLPRQHRFRFRPGAQHHVKWRCAGLSREITRIVPQCGGESLSAAEYLAHLQEKIR